MAEEAYEFLMDRGEQLERSPWGHRVNWSTPEQFHLTLRFLGETDEAMIDPLGEALRAALMDIKPFTLQLQKPSLFPRPSRARVIASLVSPAPELKLAMRRINKAVHEVTGEPVDQGAFRAHITYGRIKQGMAKKAPNLPSYRGEAVLEVHSIDLLTSQPGSEGAIYTLLTRCELS